MRGNRRMTQQKSNNEFEVKWKKKALEAQRRRKIAPHENDESKKKKKGFLLKAFKVQGFYSYYVLFQMVLFRAVRLAMGLSSNSLSPSEPQCTKAAV